MSTPDKPTPPQTTLEAKLETEKNTTPEQIVDQLETEAKALSVLPDVQETKESVTKDMRAFADRMKSRANTLYKIDQLLKKQSEIVQLPEGWKNSEAANKILNELFKTQGENPGLDMAKQLVDWGQLIRHFRGIPEELIEVASLIESGENEFKLAFKGEWPEFRAVLVAAKRLNAYIQPLLGESDGEGTLPIRAIIATLNGISFDLAKTFRPHGIEIDDVQILSSAPSDAEIDMGQAEGFLLMGGGKTLPLKQMRNFVLAKQKETAEPIVTDVLELGWSYQGERQRKTTVTPYREGTWDTAIGGYDIPEFCTH